MGYQKEDGKPSSFVSISCEKESTFRASAFMPQMRVHGKLRSFLSRSLFAVQQQSDDAVLPIGDIVISADSARLMIDDACAFVCSQTVHHGFFSEARGECRKREHLGFVQHAVFARKLVAFLTPV